MTKIKSSFLFLIMLFCYLFCGIHKLDGQSIQQDTSYNIPVVNITASKIRQQTIGSVNREWNSSQLDKLAANNVADLLGNDGGTYIKSYGLGNLATSSIRGGSAGHTLLLWNGVPIQSPMLGLLDLALLPIQTAESVNFMPGGNSALWGSGAIGGVVNMSNEANFSQKLKVKSSSQFGSFGHFQQHLKVGVGNEKIQSVTKFSHQQADNDFHYFLAEGFPDRQQTNAQLSQQNLGQDLYWKINSRNKLSLHFWWQQSDRQIPPTNTQMLSEAYQEDVSTKLLLEYKLIKNNGLWNFKAGFFDEQLNYYDPQILLESPSQFKTFLGEITRQFSWQNNELIIGNTHSHTRVIAQAYGEHEPTEYKTALFASWKFHGEKLTTQISLRQELIDSLFVPIVPSLGFEYNITPTFFINGKFSRNYRLPTFNDRFWPSGGNLELLPESGWSQEMTLKFEQKNKQSLFNISITAFNRNIDNWILWSKTAGASFLSANNITKVWSRGLEPRIQIRQKIKKLTIQFRGGYDYIRSTNQVALEQPKMEVGDQLFYTPVHHAFGTFSMEFKNLFVAYQHDFTGATKGINDPLDPFQVGNLRVQYTGIFKTFKGTLFFNLNNIWDVNYLVIERRPMPGIHFNTGINLIFNKKNNAK